jgi:hypothetical protein
MRIIFLATGLLIGLSPSLPAADSATIIDSGSTNRAGFQIDVSRSGKAVYAVDARRTARLSDAHEASPAKPPKPVSKRIPSALLKRFYADLGATSAAPAGEGTGCIKSASFGSTLTVEYNGHTSPDLNCGDHGNTEVRALIRDTGEIIKLFK